MSAHHDVVIVGAGSAGCVLAERLSASGDVSVLLIEAGGSDRHPYVRVPAAFKRLFRTSRDWHYTTQPEPHLGGRALYIPRGRMLGGSHSMNAMLYVRGDRATYDGWRDDHGCAGWGWDDVLPSFLRSEHNGRGAGPHHAIGGQLEVADLVDPNPLTERFLAACAAVGIPPVDDLNTGSPLGASMAQVTQRRGARFSVVDGYLRPALRRPNLSVVTEAVCLRVLVDGGRAVGVECRDQHGVVKVGADEVVLAAGAIGSPHLLQLSGIGPADHLRAVGIDPVVDHPKVGAGLQDHPVAGVVHEVGGTATLDDADGDPKALARWGVTRRGPLTSSVAEGLAFLDLDGDGAADLQFHFGPAYFWRHGFDHREGRAFAIGATLIAPRSRGSVLVRSADPDVHPDIRGNVLGEPSDLALLLAGVRRAEEVARAVPFDGARGRRLHPPSDPIDDADLEAWVRANLELLYHPAGTVAMGGSADAPVDPATLRLRGIDGLRVVDASVMPTVTRGNTNAPTIMIAEHAAARMVGAA